MSCSCLICAAEPPDGDASTVATVTEHGWTALWVPGPVAFAYTVGLWHTFGRPEVAMFGLDGPDMQGWLNACVHRGRDEGWPEDGVEFTGVIDGFATRLRRVDPSWNDALFGTAYRFYRGWFPPVDQLVWPDRDGRWPWDERATVTCRRRQPRAWRPVLEQPPGGWRLVGELGEDFPFPPGPDGWALTTRAILAGRRPPVRVVHAETCFDVLDDRGYGADDLCLAFLGEVVTGHPDLAGCGDLPDGQEAVWTEAGWTSAPLAKRTRKISRRLWQTVEEPLY
ncbi:DUF4262 domain-containing protein [Actinophytocola sp.]|uniref:DUF4262 domain-containing protein n=1 Tax=Actinophytocola sp. TaxID=1872138 RepID=UPI002D7EAD2A|nr:DUF4262 domain-containing protein [Actinophytocola sp.]HET9139624.1 DUF4262 domain-containing protein [Actinophytocola sp.]